MAADKTSVASISPGPIRAKTRRQSPLCRIAGLVHLLRRPQIRQHPDGRRKTLGRR